MVEMLAQKRHGTSLGGEKAPQKRQKVSGGGEASASAASVRSRTSPSPVGSSVGPEAEPQAQVRDSKQVVNQDGAAPKTFRDLGIAEPLCEACDRLKYKQPTPIQAEAIPLALAGRDVIGLAETGSGKTAAFALPILQDLLSEPRPLSALVLAPTRELAFQIRDAFAALGSVIGVRCAVVVGGMDMVAQAVELSKSGNKAPHVVVATPGRLVDHLEKTKGFSLRKLRHLVIDEADRMLDLDFGDSVDKILKFIPRERRTALFSATMSAKVESLQRASLRNPVRVSVTTPGSGSAAHAVVATLQQNILIIPHMYKDVYTVYLLSTLQSARSFIIFTRTVHMCQQLAILLRKLGFSAIPLHGQMSQSARLAALGKFKTGARSILVATDVAARGIDVPSVDVVLNYDTPLESKTYVHRVGRTARAGRAGKALTLVSQFEHEPWLRIEAALGKKFSVYEPPRDEVMVFRERVDEAARLAKEEVKELEEKGKRKGGIGKGKKAKSRTKDDMDAEEG